MIREPYVGMGQAVAKRTVFRGKENWSDVAKRVAKGNLSLVDNASQAEEEVLYKYIGKGGLLMSGRHLQHGDSEQKNRPMEVMTNCSTACSSFMLFNLLLNGSGVGRAYDDRLMFVDWDYMPKIRAVLSYKHPDYNERYDPAEVVISGIKQTMPQGSYEIIEVEDSREGWAKAFEILELATWKKSEVDKTYVFDFSKVRPEGAPIGGMQDRPSSGPVPVIKSFYDIFRQVRKKNMPLWKQAIFVDHFLARAVVVGGARRAARMATKYWKDEGAFDFCTLKTDNPETLWSANYSLTVDKHFWRSAQKDKNSKAAKLFNHAVRASYEGRTGEPGFINYDRLSSNLEGFEVYEDGDIFNGGRYDVEPDTKNMMRQIYSALQNHPVKYITNPCGEIVLSTLAGYCVIGDFAPYHFDSLEEVKDGVKMLTRALIRTNLMNAIYDKEVFRTNRIGVGPTGLHEFAWKFFNLGFRDLIDESKSQHFWDFIKDLAETVDKEAIAYSKELGVNEPHTTRTVKPAGTTSKLFDLSEGVHLPTMKEYIRWVQFLDSDPLVDVYEQLGYPVRRNLRSYSGASIVGFPQQPEICRLDIGDKLVLAGEATPEEQFKWIMLIEKYWLFGKKGNQASYTLKYNPEKVSLNEFKRIILENQSKVKCCSVMPQVDISAYEYQPEEPVSPEKFREIVSEIRDTAVKAYIRLEDLQCDSGACPL